MPWTAHVSAPGVQPDLAALAEHLTDGPPVPRSPAPGRIDGVRHASLTACRIDLAGGPHGPAPRPGRHLWRRCPSWLSAEYRLSPAQHPPDGSAIRAELFSRRDANRPPRSRTPLDRQRLAAAITLHLSCQRQPQDADHHGVPAVVALTPHPRRRGVGRALSDHPLNGTCPGGRPVFSPLLRRCRATTDPPPVPGVRRRAPRHAACGPGGGRLGRWVTRPATPCGRAPSASSVRRRRSSTRGLAEAAA
jgi:hypothetical protein